MQILKLILVFRLAVLLPNILFLGCTNPPGHLQPLGSHQLPISQGVPVYKHLLDPEVFWRDHIKPNKPALFEGVLQKLDAYHLWNDDYLQLHYGHLEISVETSKEEDRSLPVTIIPLSEFLWLYKKKPLYMVSPLNHEILQDLALPKSLQCGNFQKALGGVIGWLSNGGTKSVLHTDPLDNLLCVLEGTKQLFLTDRKNSLGLIDNTSEGYSSVDVNAVDMFKFPNLRKVPWYNVTVKRGDCVLIPFMWAHHVTSSNGRNSAVSLWFHHLLWFNYSDCQDVKLDDLSSFLKFDIFEQEQLLQYELIVLSEPVSSQLTKMQFLNVYLMANINSPESLVKLFDHLDTDNNGGVTSEEMYSCDPKIFTSYFKGYHSQSSYIHHPGDRDVHTEL